MMIQPVQSCVQSVYINVRHAPQVFNVSLVAIIGMVPLLVIVWIPFMMMEIQKHVNLVNIHVPLVPILLIVPLVKQQLQNVF